MLYSHPPQGTFKGKPLGEHLGNVGKACEKIIDSLELNLSLASKKTVTHIAYITGICHDFGKATTFFQAHILKGYTGKNSHHALFSAIFCYYVIHKVTGNELYAFISFLIVKRHHGNLETPDELNETGKRVITEQYQDIKDNHFQEVKNIYNKLLAEYHVEWKELWNALNIDDFFNLSEDFYYLIEDTVRDENKIELFLLTNLLFSCLIDSDKKDAARIDFSYLDDKKNNYFIDIEDYIRVCRKKEPDKYNLDKAINRLRSDFTSEVVHNTKISSEQHFYTLTAPTGIGKTFSAIAFASTLKTRIKKPETKIIYCLPYTSIIDQNYSEFEKILQYTLGEEYEKNPDSYLLRHHYLTPKIIRNRKEGDYTYKDYMDDKLLVESWESDHIVTTFIQLFHSIIGYRNSFLKKFHNIVNSIIILDEIQVLNPEYYLLVKDVFRIMGERFNTYFLLMTATQPEILDTSITVPLVDEKKYFLHTIFDRVDVHIQNTPRTINEFFHDFKKEFTSNNCLIVLNTKKSALSLYTMIRTVFSNNYKLFCLTTYLTPFDRLRKIKEIQAMLQENKKIIVVSTQLIEAGVDVSFEWVYRDFGLLDSIIQVAGRCNRSGEYFPMKGKMTVIRLKDEENNRFYYKYIYKNSIFEHWLHKCFGEKDRFSSLDFLKLGQNYFSYFDFEALSRRFINAIKHLHYSKGDDIAIRDFHLIEELQNQESLVICTTKETEQTINELNKAYADLKNGKLSQREREEAYINIMKNKLLILPYIITVSEKDMTVYKNTNVIRLKNDYPDIYLSYISYTNQKKYAYDTDKGFLVEPKEEPENTLSI